MSSAAGNLRASAVSTGAAFCEGCGSALAADQRWCLDCGRRRGPAELGGAAVAEAVVASAPAAPVATGRSRLLRSIGYVPDPRTSAAYVLVFLAAGVLIGSNAADAPGSLANPFERAIINIATGGGDEEESAGTSGDEEAPEPAAALAAGGSAAGAPVESSGSGGLTPPLAALSTPSAGFSSLPGPSAPADEPPADPSPAAPAGPEVRLSGTVVHVNPGAGSYSVATVKDKLFAVHAPKLPEVGADVKVGADSLFNGTLVQRKLREVATNPKAEIDGTVTFVDPERRLYTLSERGVSLLVHVTDQDPADDGKARASALPLLGDRAKVRVRFDEPPEDESPPEGRRPPEDERQPWLRQTRLEVDEEKPPKDGAPDAEAEEPRDIYVNGIVAKVDEELRELTVSADDQRRSGRDIVLKVPENVDFPTTFRKKDPVITRVTIEKDGTYTLEGAFEDGSRKAADDENGLFGTLESDSGEDGSGDDGSGEI